MNPLNAGEPGSGLAQRFDEWLNLAGLDRPKLAALVAGSADAASRDRVLNDRARAAMLWLCDPVDGCVPPLLLDIVKTYNRSVSEAARRSVSHATRLSRATSDLVDCAIARERQESPPSPESERVASRMVKLTRREYDILRLIGSARTNRQIATALRISEKTVKNHITSLFAKLQVSDRTEALVVGLRDGLLSVHDGQDRSPIGRGMGARIPGRGGTDWDSRPMAGRLVERSH